MRLRTRGRPLQDARRPNSNTRGYSTREGDGTASCFSGRALVAAAALLALVLTVLPAPSALAAESPHQDWRPALSKGQRADVNASTRIFVKATNKAVTTLDYAKAKKYDNGRVAARRKFTAGWVYWGKRVTNISKAELKKVRSYIPRKTPPIAFRGPACTGVTKQVTKSWPSYGGGSMTADLYFNSCDTDLVILAGNSAAVLAGVIAAMVKHPVATAIMAVVGGIIALGALWFDYCQRKSGLNATIYRVVHFVGWVKSQ